MDTKHSKFFLFSKFMCFILFFSVIGVVFFVPVFSIEGFYFPDRRFALSLIFGLKTSIVATILSSCFGIPAGFFLSRSKNTFSKVMDAVFEIPVIIPPLVMGAFLLIVFNLDFVKKFYNFIFTFSGAVISQFFISFPYTVKASKTAFELVPPVYEQIAMTLGAKPFRSFYDTTFKLSMGGVLSGVILSWIRSFGEFGATLLVGGGIVERTENVPIYIYLCMTEGSFEKGIWASFMIVVLSIIFLVILKIKID